MTALNLKPRQRVLAAAVGAASLALLPLIALTATPASAAVGASTLTAINVRMSPTGAVVAVLPAHAGVSLDCYDLGPRANGSNPIWYRLSAPYGGRYVYAGLVDTPVDPMPGTPGCGAPSTPAPTAVPTYQVHWTGGVGVRLRNSADLNDIRQPVVVLAENESFGLQCQQMGTPVGSRSNTTWDRISARGITAWIPDAYTTTPNGASTFTSGVPQCGGSLVPAPVPSAAQTVGQRAVDVAARYVTSDAHVWGGNACIDAHLGSGGYVGGYSGGQCRQFMNCVVYMASGGRFNPVAADYSFPGATRVSSGQAQRGDIIQRGIGGHTAIIVAPLGGGSFTVIDSNWGYTERVRQHTYTPPASASFWRYSQAA